MLLQFSFIIYFITFLVHCVNYPVLFRGNHFVLNNVTFADILYSRCSSRVSFRWWTLVGLCSLVGFVRLVRSAYCLFHAYDIKLFYNNALKIRDGDLDWLSWCSVQSRVREAQRELQMCIRKPHITELDIYQRILRFENYMVAMVNKRLLPLHVRVPLIGDVPYLSKGLKYNLELLLFLNPWSPWENCWHLRDCYKDASNRVALAKKLQNHISLLAFLNLLLAPLIQAWQILYFFFCYAELIKRSPEALGMRTWSPYSRILLRHFNELDHELSERLKRAHKPATKYLASFPSPIVTIVAKNVAFLCASVLGVIVALSVYDEVVLTVDNMLTLITALGCLLAAARSFIPDENVKQKTSEELLIQVLGHVHYLPPSWRGKAHTKVVAGHFQQLFQFRAVYILMELLSPIICPFILYSLRKRAIDIVDFYRNFTVSVLDIGDVCSFAQMDVRQHGNPDWPAGKSPEGKCHGNIKQCNQGEGGKTELSLVAFTYRNPRWRATQPSQRQYLQALHDDVIQATNNYLSVNPFSHTQNRLNRTMLCSFYQQNNYNVFNNASLFNSGLNPSGRHRLYTDVEENEEAENVATRSVREEEVKPDKNETSLIEEQEMSISTLHLYDLHLARPRSSRLSCADEPTSSTQPQQSSNSNEDTPLLKKLRP